MWQKPERGHILPASPFYTILPVRNRLFLPSGYWRSLTSGVRRSVLRRNSPTCTRERCPKADGVAPVVTVRHCRSFNRLPTSVPGFEPPVGIRRGSDGESPERGWFGNVAWCGKVGLAFRRCPRFAPASASGPLPIKWWPFFSYGPLYTTDSRRMRQSCDNCMTIV